MYEKTFDLLNKYNLNTHRKIENRIMHDFSLAKITNLGEELYNSIEDESNPIAISDIKNYQFFANSRMSALQGTGCREWRCKQKKIDNLGRFAALYSDCVYVQNYFCRYFHMSKHVKDLRNPLGQFSIRNTFACNLKALIEIKSLIISGIIRFIPTEILLCPQCHEHLIFDIETHSPSLDNAIKNIETSLVKSTSAELNIVPELEPYYHTRYFLRVNCDEDLFEHGGFYKLMQSIPSSLKRKIHEDPSSAAFSVSQKYIKNSGLIHSMLQQMALDIYSLKYYQSKNNIKYLTDNNIEVNLLKSISKDQALLSYNDILSNYIVFEMPILQNLALPDLLKIRESDYDSFITYRDTVNNIITQYISPNKPIDVSIAKEIYEDAIRPNVARLDRKLSSIKKSSIGRSIKYLAISTALLSFGLCANIPSQPLVAALVSLGLITGTKTIDSIHDTFSIPEEIKNNNFYFLWKISKKTKLI